MKYLKIILLGLVILGGVYFWFFYASNIDFSIEDFIKEKWDLYVERWGYVILFCWSILEGELGLILAGIAAHTGHMNGWLAIFIAGLGGFIGDQIYFYIGRFNKEYIQKKFSSQRRKLALAHLLLQKYGWPIIFVQRYMYGMRTIIPISIGVTRYSALKFALINLISAWIWAAITILLAWFFGNELLEILEFFKHHPYILVLAGILVIGSIVWYFNTYTKKIDKKIQKIQIQLSQKENK